MSTQRSVLVMRLGRFGDVVLALAAMQGIRKHHAEAHLVCITDPPYVSLVQSFRLFDEVIADPHLRFKPGEAARAVSFLRSLRARNFSHVYDLHAIRRTRHYLLAIEPLRHWAPRRTMLVQALRGQAYLQRDGQGNYLHISEWHRLSLEKFGVVCATKPDLTCFDDTIPPAIASALGTQRFALLVPGGSRLCRGSIGRKKKLPRHLNRTLAPMNKCWPARFFGEIAARLLARGILPVIIGTQNDAEIAETITAHAPGTLSLLDKTDATTLLALARRAQLSLCNDTGPSHLIGFAGTPIVSVCGSDPVPSFWVPLGAKIFQHDPLAELEVEEVWAAVEQASATKQRGDL